MKKRVTGIGGVFFKSEDPKKMSDWYSKHLGVEMVFKWFEVDNPSSKVPAQTIWNLFRADSRYFEPSEKPFMINYRVEDLEELLNVLTSEGVAQVGEMQSYPYGKFAWILDPEGNKIELWEPIDDGFGSAC